MAGVKNRNFDNRRRENSFFIDETKSSKKLTSRIRSRVRGIQRTCYYLDNNNNLVQED